MKKWTLNSWKKFPAKHMPKYPDQKELEDHNQTDPKKIN